MPRITQKKVARDSREGAWVTSANKMKRSLEEQEEQQVENQENSIYFFCCFLINFCLHAVTVLMMSNMFISNKEPTA